MNDAKEIMKRKWKHIDERERYKIEGMIQGGMKPEEIARELGRSKSTIYREINRGKVKQLNSDLSEKVVYLADYAQRDYVAKESEKGRPLKIGNDMEFVKFVEQEIKENRNSPYVVLCKLCKARNIRTAVCEKTLYNYIHSGIFLNITGNDLPYRVSVKAKKKRHNMALKNVKGLSIENRPKEINKRETVGHWEMDTVYGGKGTSPDCLLVLTERKSRIEEIYHMSSRTQKEVVRVLDEIEQKIGYAEFIKKYKSFTSDNGTEFLDFENIQRSATIPNENRITIYYCHPYCSGERGSNENQNKLIRRWIKKGEDISIYKEDIPFIQDWINNQPRKMFKGFSSLEIYRELVS